MSTDKDAIPAGMPLLAGANLDEGTEFMSLTPPLSCNATADEFAGIERRRVVSSLLRLPPPSPPPPY